jgi:hypothetical protein
MKCAVMFAISMLCFARETKSAQIYFPDAIRVGTTILPTGHYEMEWVVDSGAGVQVSFFQSTDTDNVSFENKPSTCNQNPWTSCSSMFRCPGSVDSMWSNKWDYSTCRQPSL